jgi:phytoene synthase
MNYAKIVKNYSKTFYYSSLFFPKEIKEEVFLLYSFVRKIDNLVDRKNPRLKEFIEFEKEFNEVWHGKKSKNKLIKDFISLAKKRNFPKAWIKDFFQAQKLDLKKKTYKNFKEFQKYTYGVAGTVGLFMAKILNLSKNTYENAIKLGQAMQIINCCRDIIEDYNLGRVYLPKEDLKKFDLSYSNFLKKENYARLAALLKFEIERAFEIESQARKSFIFFKNKRILFVVKTAADLYHKIGEKIFKNPKIVLLRKRKFINNFDLIKTLFRNFFLIYILNEKI